MPEPLKAITEQPSLTEDRGVVVPGLTAIKPTKVMKKYRPEKSSLAKLNMEEANVGEITTGEEEKTAGVVTMIDAVAYLNGYRSKEAQAPAPKAVKKGYGGGAKIGGEQIGTGKLSHVTMRRMLDVLRAGKGRGKAAPHIAHKK